jgi:hypothetical protein
VFKEVDLWNSPEVGIFSESVSSSVEFHGILYTKILWNSVKYNGIPGKKRHKIPAEIPVLHRN